MQATKSQGDGGQCFVLWADFLGPGKEKRNPGFMRGPGPRVSQLTLNCLDMASSQERCSQPEKGATYGPRDLEARNVAVPERPRRIVLCILTYRLPTSAHVTSCRVVRFPANPSYNPTSPYPGDSHPLQKYILLDELRLLFVH